MTRTRTLVLGLFSSAVVIGCVGDESAMSTTTATSAGGESQSGSVTSAPSSGGTSGAWTGATVTDGASTQTPTTTSGTTAESGDVACENMGPSIFDCDQWAQDCPECQKCAAYVPNGRGAYVATRCIDVTGTDEPGDPCTTEALGTGIDSCVEGAMCWDVNIDGHGTCVALCTGSPESPICGAKSGCAYSGALNLCLPDCDPLAQDCASSAYACYPVDANFVCVPDASGDRGQANDPCEDFSCDPGLECADPAFVGAGCPMGSAGCCTPFCEFPDGACPNPDQQCVQWFDPMQFPPNDPYLKIGACGVPG